MAKLQKLNQYIKQNQIGIDSKLGLPADIPLDPDEFYQDFGLLEHPLTKLPVQHLTAYQYAVWKDGQRHRYREVIKSQKVGITTSSLIEDFQILSIS